ncbi:hypothetical protein MNBD_GAMMA12-399 [hydrothermal vent metagenome]|uniref:Uncharacterized protein n=1 Tax=hydrothermal vent metagenome TaxID=652676 RepID=A0A3B0YY64_9ZZZZ
MTPNGSAPFYKLDINSEEASMLSNIASELVR